MLKRTRAFAGATPPQRAPSFLCQLRSACGGERRVLAVSSALYNAHDRQVRTGHLILSGAHACTQTQRRRRRRPHANMADRGHRDVAAKAHARRLYNTVRCPLMRSLLTVDRTSAEWSVLNYICACVCVGCTNSMGNVWSAAAAPHAYRRCAGARARPAGQLHTR